MGKLDAAATFASGHLFLSHLIFPPVNYHILPPKLMIFTIQIFFKKIICILCTFKNHFKCFNT